MTPMAYFTRRHAWLCRRLNGGRTFGNNTGRWFCWLKPTLWFRLLFHFFLRRFFLLHCCLRAADFTTRNVDARSAVQVRPVPSRSAGTRSVALDACGSRRVLLLFVLLFLVFVPLVVAKPREWQTATVLKQITDGTETEVVVAPLPGGGAVGQSTTTSGKHMRGVYWLKTDKFTYVIPNYAKANMVGIQWWLYLTVGGQVKISIDSVRTMHVIDDEGKDRKVHIIQRIANQP